MGSNEVIGSIVVDGAKQHKATKNLPCSAAKASMPRQLGTSSCSFRNSQEAVSISENWNRDAATKTSSTLWRWMVIVPKGETTELVITRVNAGTWLRNCFTRGKCFSNTQVDIVENGVHGVWRQIVELDPEIMSLAQIRTEHRAKIGRWCCQNVSECRMWEKLTLTIGSQKIIRNRMTAM